MDVQQDSHAIVRSKAGVRYFIPVFEANSDFLHAGQRSYSFSSVGLTVGCGRESQDGGRERAPDSTKPASFRGAREVGRSPCRVES